MGFSGWNDGVLESRYVGTIQSMSAVWIAGSIHTGVSTSYISYSRPG